MRVFLRSLPLFMALLSIAIVIAEEGDDESKAIEKRTCSAAESSEEMKTFPAVRQLQLSSVASTNSIKK